MHILHLHFGPNQGNDVSNFIFDGKLFHIFGPKDLKLWVTKMKEALISFRVLNVSTATDLNMFTSMVDLFLL